MKHNMKLQPNPFQAIVNGMKTIEIRLYDEKRRQVNIGDEIEFLNEATGQTVVTKVVKLHLFSDFGELYEQFDKIKLGYKEYEEAKSSDMEKYYSKEDILKYGVVGIEIELKK